MGKNNNFLEKPIFSQLINLLDTLKFAKSSEEYASDYYHKRFYTSQYTITTLYGVLYSRNSLKQGTSIVNCSDKISHCKFNNILGTVLFQMLTKDRAVLFSRQFILK